MHDLRCSVSFQVDIFALALLDCVLVQICQKTDFVPKIMHQTSHNNGQWLW